MFFLTCNIDTAEHGLAITEVDTTEPDDVTEIDDDLDKGIWFNWYGNNSFS